MSVAVTIKSEIASEHRLGETLSEYEGEWVAVRDYTVVAHADTLRELLEQIEGQEEVEEVFHVPTASASACFY